MVSVTGKIALVTGGGTGIGKAIAAALAQKGAKVAIASRTSAHVEGAAQELQSRGLAVLALRLDVTKKSDIERGIEALLSQWGPPHILVNNAGISGLSMIDDPDDGQWFDIVNTNLNGLYLITKAVLRHMPTQAGGRVINISSVLGKFGVPGYTAYCTTKHGVIGFTRALALEVVSRGITVNTVCPGWVDTEMAALGINETAALQGITPAQFKAQAIEAVPIKRFLDARRSRRARLLYCFRRSWRYYRAGDQHLRRPNDGVRQMTSTGLAQISEQYFLSSDRNLREPINHHRPQSGNTRKDCRIAGRPARGRRLGAVERGREAQAIGDRPASPSARDCFTGYGTCCSMKARNSLISSPQKPAGPCRSLRQRTFLSLRRDRLLGEKERSIISGRKKSARTFHCSNPKKWFPSMRRAASSASLARGIFRWR